MLKLFTVIGGQNFLHEPTITFFFFFLPFTVYHWKENKHLQKDIVKKKRCSIIERKYMFR